MVYVRYNVTEWGFSCRKKQMNQNFITFLYSRYSHQILKPDNRLHFKLYENIALHSSYIIWMCSHSHGSTDGWYLNHRSNLFEKLCCLNCLIEIKRELFRCLFLLQRFYRPKFLRSFLSNESRNFKGTSKTNQT